MRRRVVNIASALLLLLCAATVVLWVRSKDEISDCRIGRFLFMYGWGEFEINRFADGDHGFSWSFVVKFWQIAGGLLLLPVMWFFASRLPRRFGTACCPKCRYNLTGNTSGVCPECGTAVAGNGA